MVDEDTHAARWALRSGRPVLLVVNKVDDAQHEASSWEFLGLGAGDPHTVSAQHGRGTGDLLDVIVARLEESRMVEEVADADDDGALRVAIVGRPNVGKSTLFNQLIGEERSVVHDLPGTTRDAIDTLVSTDVGLIRFIDTAGMRRRAKTEAGLETYAVLRSLDALDRSDIAILVIDATVGATGQDQRLAERISAAGCPSLVVLNKWELVAVGRTRLGPRDGRREAGLPGRRAGDEDDRDLGQGRAPDPPGAGDRGGRLPEAGTDRCAQTARSAISRSSSRRRRARSATPCRERPSRRPSRCSSPGDCPRRTCATSNDPCASGSPSDRNRCECAFGSNSDQVVRAVRSPGRGRDV